MNNSDGSEDGGVLADDPSYLGTGSTVSNDDKYSLVNYNNDCSVIYNSGYNVNNQIILPPNKSATVSGDNCTINIRDIKHVTLERSGYVRFFKHSLNLLSSTSCTLKVAITNQNESGDIIHEKFNTDTFIKEIIVQQGENKNSIGEFLSVFADPIYLRKGQTLLFLPDSWIWSDGDCDINTLMHIEYRPAVFCKDVGVAIGDPIIRQQI